MSSKAKSHRCHHEGRFTVVVRFLEENSQEEIHVPEDATGKWLFEEVCRHQNIMEEKEYFGLRYLEHEMLSPPTKQWISLSRGVFVQLRNTYPRLVSFRFKHYPADPLTDLRLPKTYYLLYHQLRRDLHSGRLAAADETIVRLAALVLQVELGDSSVQDSPRISIGTSAEQSYVTGFKVLHNQTQNTEVQLLEEHKNLEGLLPSEAAMEMIELASKLETYGIDPVRVKTKAFGARPIHLGLTHRGVAEFLSNRRQHLFPWSEICWMTCDGRYFVIAITKTSSKKKKATETIRFKCESKAVARALWEWATDRQLFMTLERSSSAHVIKWKRGLFSRSHTFKFSGRCRREVLGRHALSATLPAGLGASLTDTPGSSGNTKLVTDSVTNEMSRTDRELCCYPEPLVIERERNEKASKPSVTEALSVQLNHSSSGFTFDSRVSTMCTTLSEPTEPGFSSSYESVTAHRQNATLVGNLTDHSLRVQTNQLVPYFERLSRRRYAPSSLNRQRKFEQRWNSPSRLVSGNEDWSTEAAIAELHAAVEAGQAWAEEDTSNSQVSASQIVHRTQNESPSNRSDVISSFHQSTPCSTVNHKGPFMGTTDDLPPIPNQAEEKGPPSELTTRRSPWRFIALSAGFITGVSLLGLALLLETETHSAVTTALREHPLILDFDTRFYRPFRSAIFGFWRRF